MVHSSIQLITPLSAPERRTSPDPELNNSHTTALSKVDNIILLTKTETKPDSIFWCDAHSVDITEVLVLLVREIEELVIPGQILHSSTITPLIFHPVEEKKDTG